MSLSCIDVFPAASTALTVKLKAARVAAPVGPLYASPVAALLTTFTGPDVPVIEAVVVSAAVTV